MNTTPGPGTTNPTITNPTTTIPITVGRAPGDSSAPDPWSPRPSAQRPAVRRGLAWWCGGLRVSVRPNDPGPDTTAEAGTGWVWRVEAPGARGGVPVEGTRLSGTALEATGAREALLKLVSWLTEAAQSHGSPVRDRSGGARSLPGGWLWVAVAENAGDLELARLDLARPEPVPSPAADDAVDPGAGGWREVVQLEGLDGFGVVDLIKEHGAHAAVAHLAPWNLETHRQPSGTGRVRQGLPVAWGARVVEHGPYALIWSPDDGHVALWRRTAGEEPAAPPAASPRMTRAESWPGPPLLPAGRPAVAPGL